MSAPKRIQLRRTKGWRKPEGAVNVARPSRYGNPYRVVDFERHTGERWPIPAVWWILVDSAGRRVFPNHPPMSRSDAIDLAVTCFEGDLRAGLLAYTVEDVRRELAGRDLLCWCPLDGPCHADVLLAIANGDA